MRPHSLMGPRRAQAARPASPARTVSYSHAMASGFAGCALRSVATLFLAGALLGCSEHSGRDAQDATQEAVVNASIAGAITLADQVARSRAARQAERDNQHFDACPGWQCYSSTDMSLEEARDYALLYINHARSEAGMRPLVLDYGLNAFAQAGSKLLFHLHRAHQYIAEHPTDCGECAESQGDPDGVAVASVRIQLDAALGGMLGEPPGSTNHDVLLASERHRVGVGIVNADGRAYLTIDCAP